MIRESFHLTKFKLKDRQDVLVEFKLNGKEIVQKFTEPVHPDLLNAFQAFTEKFELITGLVPGKDQCKEIDPRGITIITRGENTSFILSAVVSFEAGKGNINTPKVFIEDYSDLFGDTAIDEQIKELESEVFALVYKNKNAQLQFEFGDEDEISDDENAKEIEGD